jgi:hypothetical protein
MHLSRLLGTCAAGAALWLGLPAALAPLATPVAFADDSTALRPAVGKPLEKAKSLMAAHSYAAASAQVALADKQKGKSAYENFVIEQMRGAIAQASGDTATASRVYQDLINSGRIGGAQLTQLLLAETSLSYQMKDYKAVISWADRYTKSGGHDPAVRTLVIQSYYLQNDYANAAKYQKAAIDDLIAAHKVPPEDQLQLLAACQKQLADSAGMTATMGLLVTYYPKPSYWVDLIYSVQTTPGFSDRLEYDLDRFKLRVGTLTAEPDFMQMAEMALGDNDPGGALNVIAQANALHVFGTPAQAPREQRLAAMANSTAADTKAKLDSALKDLRSSNATTSQQLYEAGQNYASFGNYATGIPLMEEAIGHGDLRRPGEAQLRVGEALIDEGDKPGAIAALQKVPPSTDGSSDLAKLWLLWLNTQPTLTPIAH